MSSTLSPFIVYALIDPRTDEVFYVGKSCSRLKRPRQHWTPGNLSKRAGRPLTILLQGILGAGLIPRIDVLEEIATAEELGSVEKKWVAHQRSLGVILANQTDGGGGCPGWKHSEEARRRIGEFHKGKVLSAETLRRLSIAHKGARVSPEHARKISLAHIGMRYSDATRKKISDARKGKGYPRKIKILKGQGRPQTAETRAKISLAKRGEVSSG